MFPSLFFFHLEILFMDQSPIETQRATTKGDHMGVKPIPLSRFSPTINPAHKPNWYKPRPTRLNSVHVSKCLIRSTCCSPHRWGTRVSRHNHVTTASRSTAREIHRQSHRKPAPRLLPHLIDFPRRAILDSSRSPPRNIIPSPRFFFSFSFSDQTSSVREIQSPCARSLPTRQILTQKT